jgi:hypothetical protein
MILGVGLSILGIIWIGVVTKREIDKAVVKIKKEE